MEDTRVRPSIEALKQETLQSMVHDMRTPMTVLKGNLLMLLHGIAGQISSEQELLLKRSMGPLEDLIQMTENMLQAFTLDQGQIRVDLAETDLDHLLSETLEFYQIPFKQRGMQLYREGNTFGTRLRIDSFWIKRVLHNLVWNAYKFTPDQGKVIVHVSRRDEGLEIAVQDTGRGIPKERIHRLFQKFEQVIPSDRRLGTGLGLWICKRVMELHGGSIRAESEEGRGTSFILQFPSTSLS